MCGGARTRRPTASATLCCTSVATSLSGSSEASAEDHSSGIDNEEFDERTHIAPGELLRRLRAVVEEAAQVIDGLDADALLTSRQIQGYDVTVLEAVYHVVEHFGMHTGQIILLSKARTGADLRLWEPPGAASA